MMDKLSLPGKTLAGQATPQTPWNEHSRISFAIQQALVRLQTSLPVRVVGVTNAGGVSPVGFVDVVPMLNQMDSQGNPTPHTTIFNVPYMRLQGGNDAVIIDPKVGDIGVGLFASRDISKVKKTRKPANPGSLRKWDFADCMYVGGLLNGAPTQYIRFAADGITLHSPQKVKLEAPVIELIAGTSILAEAPTVTLRGNIVLDGPISQTNTAGGGTTAELIGPLNVSNDVTAQGTSLHGHQHGNVQNGSGTTSAPI